MKNDEKNAGTSPLPEHYGDNRNSDSEIQNKPTPKQADDGVSGKKDQLENAAKHTDVEGHDDLDQFDMDSLKGDVG
jgi:hypothetical protein